MGNHGKSMNLRNSLCHDVPVPLMFRSLAPGNFRVPGETVASHFHYTSWLWLSSD